MTSNMSFERAVCHRGPRLTAAWAAWPAAQLDRLGFTKGPLVLHPNQFQVNEAWIAFTLNESPIRTERDGSFNCICLMDAASCFILANALVPLNEAEPSQLETRRLFKMARAHKNRKPTKLFVPTGQFETNLRAEAKRQGIDVIPVDENQLSIFIGEARLQRVCAKRSAEKRNLTSVSCGCALGPPLNRGISSKSF